MRPLSKSKLLAYRQCPKRLWLEIHQAAAREDSASTQASFATGHLVGDIARQIYDPSGTGALIDMATEGFEAAFARTQTLLAGKQPIFEAGFRAAGALAFADVLLPVTHAGKKAWRMVEVKSSTSVKDYHRDDAAIQAFTARSAGAQLSGIALAHIDTSWVYPGGGNYAGLLAEVDLTEEAFARGAEVAAWIAEAQTVSTKRQAPAIRTGAQCSAPYECGFLAHCQSQEPPMPQAEHPITFLPRRSATLNTRLEENQITELCDVPDEWLNAQQLRVKKATLSGKRFFNKKAAAEALADCTLPAYFVDFETIRFVVPIWSGTHPYQQVPYQFSVHRVSRSQQITHTEFLDVSGNDPSENFATALIAACGKQGAVFVYNAAFETTRIRELAERFAHLADALLAINQRVVDLLPIAREHFYHPSQQGSWSIKAVLPAACPDLGYDQLEGVQDGGMAMEAFLEAITPETTASRKTEIEKQLRAYCQLDTWAMVRLWGVFAGKTDITQ